MKFVLKYIMCKQLYSSGQKQGGGGLFTEFVVPFSSFSAFSIFISDDEL